MSFLATIYSDILKHRTLYSILALLALLMALTLHAGKAGADGGNYLRWTHSFVFDRDLHLLNNAEATGGSYNLTPTGFVFERVNIGAPLMWSPFYGSAALFLPPPAATESYPAAEIVQYLWVNFSSWLYTILGGILTIGALRKLFDHRTLATAILAILLGTPVLFYMVTYPLSSHPATLFLSALLLYLWLANDQQRSRLHRFTIGVVIGWLMLMASYNIVFFCLPGLELLKDFTQTRNWRRVLLNGLAVGAGGIVGFLPQMIVWGFLFGNPFSSPYAGQLLWSEPYWVEVLFSTFHGLFFYAPVLLLVIPGLWLGRRYDGWLALSIGLSWAALAYLASVNVAWWAGSSFGNRYFLTLTPFLVFGLAAFIEQTKGWARLPVLACVVWTTGLYLQFMDDVIFVSDSAIYSAAELIRGQLTIFAHAASIVPRFWQNRPWPFVPAVTLPIFVLLLVLAGRLLYGWVDQPAGSGRLVRAMITAGGVAIVLFVTLAGFRGEQVKAALASRGFYEQDRPMIRREIKELAGKAGLVTRAFYHRQIGRPQQAIADLQRASQLWQREEAQQPTRLYLGPKDSVSAGLPLGLHLDYAGNVRLVGYQILEANRSSVTGRLFWEKRPGDRPRDVVQPVIRAYDRAGTLLGTVTLDFPFPAHYLPPGSLFQDTFELPFDHWPDGWLWLAVGVSEDLSLPTNAQGEAESGIIASVNPETFPPTSLIPGEAAPALVGQPVLPLGPNYQPGQSIPIQLTWQATTNAAAALDIALISNEAAGEPVVRQSYPLDDLAKAEVQSSTYCFPLPAAAAPGDYRLGVAFNAGAAAQLLDHNQRPVHELALPVRLAATEEAAAPSICALIQNPFPRRYEPTQPQHPVEASLTPAIRLAGYDLSIIPQATAVRARITLHWHIEANVSRDYLVSITLLNGAEETMLTQTGLPAHGSRPTPTWLAGEWILDEHIVEIPTLAPGSYQLRLAFLSQQTDQPVRLESGRDYLILQDIQIP